MTTNIQSDIAAVRAKLDAVSAELRALEERAKQEATAQARWEPKGGAIALSAHGVLRDLRAVVAVYEEARLAGSLYPTREAAESALPYVTFFKRLCCLAQELNPSGKVGGRYFVAPRVDGKWLQYSFSSRTPDCVFETEEAATRAAEILTRDGWRAPSL